MANIIKPKSSTVAAKVPTSSDLALGEIAINHQDALLYARHPGTGAVQAIGGGSSSITVDSTAADLLSFSSGALSADDLGSDKIFFWDDSAGRATGLSVGTGLTISGTTLEGASSTTIGASAADVLSIAAGEITADDAGADKLLFWDDSAGKLTHLDLGTALSITGTTLNASSGTYLASKTLARFTASKDNQPPATAYATLDTRNSIAVLDFDAALDESAVFSGVIPDYANLSSGLKVRLTWMATSATSGNCRWGVQFEKANTDLDADSFSAATEAHSAANATSGIVTTTEITATAIDSLAVGDTFRIKVYRKGTDATNDTMTGDAELISVEVQQV